MGYFFSPGSMAAVEIASIIKDAIRNLEHIGLQVCTGQTFKHQHLQLLTNQNVLTYFQGAGSNM